MKIFATIIASSLMLWSLGVHALESDREQPATINADEVDIDFGSGKRTYKGNVKLRQGTIKLDADKLEVYFKDNQLQKAIAKGDPAKFEQQPDGKPLPVKGSAKYIHMDEIKNVVTLTRNAKLTQGQDAVNGKTIIYDMANDKMKILGNTTTTKMPESETTGQASAAPAQSTSKKDDEKVDGGSRASITLKPKAEE